MIIVLLKPLLLILRKKHSSICCPSEQKAGFPVVCVCSVPHYHRVEAVPVHLAVASEPETVENAGSFSNYVIASAFGFSKKYFFSDYYSAKKLYPEQAYYVDYSSLVSGLLLSLMVPVQTSVWAIFLAALFGSLLVKQAFGGVGTNIFNPALASRAFLEWIVPSQMAVVESPFSGTWHLSSLFTGKPLASTAQTVADSPWTQIVSGRMAGMVGTTSIVLLGLGLVILIERKLFRFEASLSYILVLIVGYVPCYIHNVDPQSFLLWLSVHFEGKI